ncbi:hypothetical protein DMUE_2935 [Dictyocoela muelleri]|nr:hypothetical protein DMUE_2935 [Dictyocoela muelleri]
MRPLKNPSNIGAPEVGKYLRSEKKSFEVLLRFGILKSESRCTMCFNKMNICGGINRYFYCKRSCRNEIYRRQEYFGKYKNSIYPLYHFCHYFYNRTIITKNILRDTKLSRGTIMKLKYKIKNKIRLYNQKNKIMMGGIGSIVEVDESLMSSANMEEIDIPNKPSIGIVERETGKCYIEVVPDRKRKLKKYY